MNWIRQQITIVAWSINPFPPSSYRRSSQCSKFLTIIMREDTIKNPARKLKTTSIKNHNSTRHWFLLLYYSIVVSHDIHLSMHSYCRKVVPWYIFIIYFQAVQSAEWKQRNWWYTVYNNIIIIKKSISIIIRSHTFLFHV